MAENTTTNFEAAAYTARGTARERVSLPAGTFDGTINMPVMHQAVKAYLANQRQGNASTKNRKVVTGGNQKPWKQKGTGRARQGSTRAPQWVGGGVALGPKPRDYAQKTPKKMIRLALLSALSDRASSGDVIVIDGWSFEQPSTKQAVAALKELGCDTGRTLLVLGDDDRDAWLSFRNLGERVHPILARELNAYDVLVADRVIFTQETLPTSQPKEPVAETAVDIKAGDTE